MSQKIVRNKQTLASLPSSSKHKQPETKFSTVARGAGTAEIRSDALEVFEGSMPVDKQGNPRAWEFDEVWKYEQATIRARRARLQATDARTENKAATIVPYSQSSLEMAAMIQCANTDRVNESSANLQNLQQEQPKAAVVETVSDSAEFATLGLALSGGGIRSAAFNLGVLQAFAEQKLIGNLDYLSTVSGGGYIGSWLTCWICRDGDVRNVEKLLVPSREENAKAKRQFVDPQQEVQGNPTPIVKEQFVSGKEPEPLAHLRANSNYLALRPGIFTPDSWTLIAIYLRNILLNLLVIMPTLFFAILFTMWLSSWYVTKQVMHTHVAFAISIILVIVGVVGIFFSLDGVRKSKNNDQAAGLKLKAWDKYFEWFVLATVAAAYAISVDIVSEHSWYLWLATWGGEIKEFKWWYGARAGLTLGACHMALNIVAIFHMFAQIFRKVKEKDLYLWPLSGFAAGFVMGFLIYASACFMREFSFPVVRDILTKYEYQSLLAVPLLLTSFFVSEVIQVGILGRLELAEVREKWSAFQARCFMAGMIWFILVLHVYFIANFVALYEYFKLSPTVAWATAGGTWLVSAFGSLILAQSSSSSGQSGNSNNRRWIDVLVMAGPPIFLSGIVAATSAFVLNYVQQVNIESVSEHRMLSFAGGLLMLTVGITVGRFVDINIFSLQELYAARLIRCFLGASRRDDRPPRGAPFTTSSSQRRPDLVTSMAMQDDLTLASLRTSTLPNVASYNGPLHLINTAVNLTRDIDLQRQERKADSFTLSPIACGNPSLKYRPTWMTKDTPGYAGGINLGTAAGLSGAALSPNMGYYSSPAVTALLTFFNVRLGAWLINPSAQNWTATGPTMGWFHLLKEMMGLTDSTSKYVYISDGGHFDNLGVYELLRRRVTCIFASDAGADPDGHCNELGMIIRKAFVDFGIRIEIDASALKIDPSSSASKSNFAVGKVNYPKLTLSDGTVLPESVGTFFYIKLTRTGQEPTDIEAYHRAHPDFPHQSTVHQFYGESQFESYRHLGYHTASSLLSGPQGSYQPGHPRRQPKTTRTTEQVKKYIDYLQALHSIHAPENWDEMSAAFDDKYAALISRLYTHPRLRKLRTEIDKITEILEVCEDLYHADGNDTSIAELSRCRLRGELQSLHEVERDAEEKAFETAWSIEAFTLINNLMTVFRWDAYQSTLRTEWIRVIRQWTHTSAFQLLWPTLRRSYPAERIEFVSNMLGDREWVCVPYPAQKPNTRTRPIRE